MAHRLRARAKLAKASSGPATAKVHLIPYLYGTSPHASSRCGTRINKQVASKVLHRILILTIRSLTHLSRYCAYLMTWLPELLPDDDAWSKDLYEAVKKDADRVLAGRVAVGSSSTPEAE